MTKPALITSLLGLTLLVSPVLVSLAQITIEPPPSTATAPASAPATAAAPTVSAPAPATLPTAENVLENLLHSKPAATPINPAPAASATAIPPLEAVAPNEPKVTRLREGTFIWNRVGRLVKDEKSETWIFTFDADGKDMSDPPMAILPSRMLMAMEEASDKGAKPIKFKISGEVTEYRGKNFLLIKFMQSVKDLNKGLGG